MEYLRETVVSFNTGEVLTARKLQTLNDTINQLVRVVNDMLEGKCDLNIELNDFNKEFTLKEAIESVSKTRRHLGMKVRFLSSEQKKYLEYSYLGTDLDNNNWTNTDNWVMCEETLVDGGGLLYKKPEPGPEPEPEPEPETNYVDLGLPSGTLWAKENIKDSNKNELFFAWGEIDGYTAEQVGVDKNFTWGDGFLPNDYRFGPINWYDQTNYGLSKYNNSDNKIKLDSEDDAATQLLGSDWRIPTYAEFEELLENTRYEWTEIDGIVGGKLTSTVSGYTDKYLFFPAVGIAMGGMINGAETYGLCWSKSLNEYIGDANLLYFNNRESRLSNNNRCYGFSIRPVKIIS